MATIEPILKSINKTQKYIQTLLNQRQSLNSAVKNYNNSLFENIIKEISQKFDEDSGWLLSFDWPPLMHAPVNFVNRLRQYCDGMDPAKAQKEINESILGFYTPDRIRNEILKPWETKTFLRHRIHILRSAIEAHISSNYALSVPALLPQLEGIVAENFKHKGRMMGDKYKEYLKQIMPERGKGVNSLFNRLFSNLILEHVLMNFKHGQPILFDLNRHAILHGADVKYSTPTTSLKAIIVIDFIIKQIRFVSLVHSNVYHSPECRIIIQSKKPRKVYSWRVDALVDGKLPCKKCCIHTSD
jgi:hypothetical protein